MFSNIDLAVVQTVRDYPGGGRALAKVLGLPESSLANKANPNMDERHFSPSELLAMMLETGDHRILQAFAAEMGLALIPLAGGEANDPSVISLYLALDAEHGNLARALLEAGRDKVYTPNERKAILAEALGVMKALNRFVREIKAAEHG